MEGAVEKGKKELQGRKPGVLQYRRPPEGVSTVLANVGLTERCDGASSANSLGFSAMICLRRTPQGRDERELSAIRDLPMADGSWLGEAVRGLSSLPVGNSALMAPYLLGSPHCFFFSHLFFSQSEERGSWRLQNITAPCAPLLSSKAQTSTLGSLTAPTRYTKEAQLLQSQGCPLQATVGLCVQFNKAVSE